MEAELWVGSRLDNRLRSGDGGRLPRSNPPAGYRPRPGVIRNAGRRLLVTFCGGLASSVLENCALGRLVALFDCNASEHCFLDHVCWGGRGVPLASNFSFLVRSL